MSRWDPFRDPMSIQDEPNRLFGRTYGGESGDGAVEDSTSKIDARFDKGVLSIEVPKAEKAKPTKITIKATA